MPYCWGWHVNGRCPKMMVRPFTLNSSPPHQGHAHCRAIARRDREQAEEGVDGCGRCVQSSRRRLALPARSEEHTSELQSLMRISYDVCCLKKKKRNNSYNEMARRKYRRQ